MKDVEILEQLFEYLYKNSSCVNIQEEVNFKGLDKALDSDESFRIYKLIISTGLVDELNYSVGGNHRAFMLNDKGYQAMLKHGSYLKYLEAIERPDKLDESVKKSTIWSNYGNLMIGVLSFIGGAILSEPIKQLWQIVRSFFQ